jgi:glycosyltransferase involved in cell wall biosynthesis
VAILTSDDLTNIETGLAIRDHLGERWVDVLHEYGWISDLAIDVWKGKQGYSRLVQTHRSDKWLILTRNAIHGGVESLIREEAEGLNAPVVVCGGHNRIDTCPFEYTRADNPKKLERVIAEYDIILYHWLPDWCLDVLRRSGKPCIEFVHRTDTAESDKVVPTALVTHSAFLARYVCETFGRSCRVVDHPIAIDRFKPQPVKGKFVGAITSYYHTKGIDIFLQAWAYIKNRFPEYGVRFYGAGDDLSKFQKLASELGLNVDFRDATREPWEAMKDFACFVVPSRIEGLPVAILEALAMNIPVVASDLAGMVEFNQLSEARGYSPRCERHPRAETRR